MEMADNGDYDKMRCDLLHGDCLELLKDVPSESIDLVLTDPPYGLAMMGLKWDQQVPPLEVWNECLRTLKPGGFLLSFAGTRTYHRVASKIEDAGFEIRDMIAWVYGCGFPKGNNLAMMFDKKTGLQENLYRTFNMARETDKKFEGKEYKKDRTSLDSSHPDYKPYEPKSDMSREWNGWNTVLKPALEPIAVARKPMEGGYYENLKKYGVGALNIEDCRVGTEIVESHGVSVKWMNGMNGCPSKQQVGRYPANLIHDGSEEVVACFPCSTSSASLRKNGKSNIFKGYGEIVTPGHADSGSNARFFYCAKASLKEREGNNHPTVKPLSLMEYLIRLTTREGYLILDPFMGSGSTGVAAIQTGRKFLGMELDEKYFNIAKSRMDNALEKEPAA